MNMIKFQKIKIIIEYKVKSLSELFYNCQCIEMIKFVKFNNFEITDMNGMFYGCTNFCKK